MADIRINSLPSTATSFNTDDYIAIDGASGGTRKMLAATLPLTDVTFGSSGPSAKSSIAARASRQGLVFDGTAITNTANVPAFGSGDFTFAAWVNQPTLAAAYLCSSTGGADDTFMYLTGSGTFQWWSNSVARATSSAGAVQAGKWTLLTATRTGGTTTLYANGVSVGSGADTQNITSAIDRIGGRSNSTNIINGSLVPLIYNRALSAAEVVALYEAGVPAGADYNNAGTNIVSSTFASGWVTNAGSPTIAATATLPSGSSIRVNGFTTTANRRYRFTVTVDSISAGSAEYYNGSTWVQFATAAGTYTIDWTPAAANVFGFQATGGNVVLSSPYLTTRGLLLAPDAGQAGGGLTWYDTSGNAANITLPASGVTWNVPSSRYLGGNWTTSGNLTVSGTGTSSVAGKLAVGTTAVIGSAQFTIKKTTDKNLNVDAAAGAVSGISLYAGTDADAYTGLQVDGDKLYLNVRSGGNVLVGTTTDNGARTTISRTGAAPATSGSTSNATLRVVDTSNNIALDFGVDPASPYAPWIQACDRGNLATNYPLSLQRNGGNVLIGTTYDGGNGKLQLATHTTSAGGIGFGTDVSLYRIDTNGLALSGSGGTVKLQLFEGASLTGQLASNSGNIYLDASGAKSIIFRTNSSTTALTLDSSQNATFAKNVTASGGTALFQATNANSIVHIKVNSDTYNPYIRLEGYDRSIYVGVKDAGADGTFNISTAAALTSPMLSLDPATNGATFAGAIAIGNTVQTAAAVASTHKVTISIGGVTYYLLATNV